MNDGTKVALCGGGGGLCMPALAMGQTLLHGSTLSSQFGSMDIAMGWIIGCVLTFVVGGFVAWVIESHANPYIKALVIGLTLPATLAALSQTSRTDSFRVSSLLINSAFAQSASPDKETNTSPAQDKTGASNSAPQKFVIFFDFDKSILTPENWPTTQGKWPTTQSTACATCRVLFLDALGDPTEVVPLKNIISKAAYIPVPDEAHSITMLYPGGTTAPVRLPPSNTVATARNSFDDLTLKIQARSDFSIGFRRALGLPSEKFELKLTTTSK